MIIQTVSCSLRYLFSKCGICKVLVPNPAKAAFTSTPSALQVHIEFFFFFFSVFKKTIFRRQLPFSGDKFSSESSVSQHHSAVYMLAKGMFDTIRLEILNIYAYILYTVKETWPTKTKISC